MGKPKETSIRQRILASMESRPGEEFDTRSFSTTDIPTRNISVALRELRLLKKIHLHEKRKVPDVPGRVWIYRLGPPIEDSSLNPPTSSIDIDTAYGWRDVSPWMFSPIGLPKGKLRTIKML
jgi:hypothetical protein